MTVFLILQRENGDVIHVGDFDPRNPGLETFTAKEDYGDGADRFSYDTPILAGMKIREALNADQEFGRVKWGIHLQDAKTGRFLQTINGSKDTGRGMIANIGYGNSYYVMWGAGGTGYHDSDGNVADRITSGGGWLSMNGRIYWDGDLQDELQDHYGANDRIKIEKWDDKQGQRIELFAPEGTHSVNSTKGNTSGQADMFGDWREEFVTFVETGKTEVEEDVVLHGSFDVEIPAKVTKTKYSFALRVYTTTIPTKYNFYTLVHDDVYRNSSGAYNNCYNQPPHISWYMNDYMEGSEYTTQPAPNISLVNNSYKAQPFSASALPDKGSGRVWTPGEAAAAPEGAAGDGAAAGSADISGAAGVEGIQGLGLFEDCINHWSKDNINYLAQKGIVNGVTDTMFYPDNTVTKGEFLKMAVAAAGLPTGSAASGSHWATPYYAAALKANMLPAGLNLKANQLDELIDREEMASLVCAAAKAKSKSINSTPVTFTDASQISGALSEYVFGAANLGIIEGFDDGSFAPAATATRAQAAAMLARLVSQL